MKKIEIHKKTNKQAIYERWKEEIGNYATKKI